MLAALSLAVTAQGPVSDTLVATGQLLAPVGTHLVLNARPVDLAMSPTGEYVLVKENRGVTVVRASDWTLVQESKVTGGASMYGLLCTPDGTVLFSDARSAVHRGKLGEDGTISWGDSWALPAPKVGGQAYPCGLAQLPTGGVAVCASRSNSLVVFDGAGKVVRSYDVDVAPFDVAISGRTAVVSCWGKRKKGKAGQSSGSEVDIDDRGVALGGSVDFVDLDSGRVTRTDAGLQPSQIVTAGSLAYVSNANSDTVGVYDIGRRRKVREVVVKPNAKLPFGSAPGAMALSESGRELYVALGGNNAIAVLTTGSNPQIKGLIPTNWYPGALAIKGEHLYVACIKGIGSRNQDPARGFNVHRYTGSVTQTVVPDDLTLKTHTAKVAELANAPAVLEALSRSKAKGVQPVPVPKRLGEPSPIQHVVYVIKENRTYDQVLGDIGRGDSMAKLCIYGSEVSPNHHALANEFVLLDNYYCNGVNSADGHAWAVEGIATSYLERSFGGFTRSYPFGGDDALAVASSGSIWDAVLGAGLSFRNYGEGDYAGFTDQKGWTEVFSRYRSGTAQSFKQSIAIDQLRRYSCREYPGWNLGIPDQLRADVFLKELDEFESKGIFPNLTIIYLPQDHTSGVSPGLPTPKACVADNDLALGRIVDRLSHSTFWPKMAIFVNEDDPQDGFDHVDGHRSFCFVISPYSKRRAVVSDFYNQTSVLHTMLQVLGVPPMNQFDARSPLMTSCFSSVPDMTPYTAKPANIPLDQLTTVKGGDKRLIAKTRKLEFDRPDEADEGSLNEILWRAARADAYPKGYTGAHGKGLKKRGLKLDRSSED